MDGLFGSLVDVAEMGPDGSAAELILVRVPNWLLESKNPGSHDPSEEPKSVVAVFPLTDVAGWKLRPISRVVHRYAAKCFAAS